MNQNTNIGPLLHLQVMKAQISMHSLIQASNACIECTDQTAQMHRLAWTHAVCI